MIIVYMGFLAKVFNWVFEKILAPVIKFIGHLLEVVLGWVFENILGPLLTNIFWPLFNAVLEIIIDVFAAFFYGIMASLFTIIDSMETAFNIFAGLQDVTYGKLTGSLLEVLIRMPSVHTAVMMITGMSFVLLMMFAIIATVRSTLDFSFEGQRPVSRVLNMTFKGMFRLITIPLTVLIVVQMSTVLLQSLHKVFSAEESSLSSMVFVVSSLDAAKDPAYNVSGIGEDDKTATPLDDIGISDAKRAPYYERKSGYDYTSLDDVRKNFELGKFDYFVGYGGCIFLILIMAVSLFSFIRRIFEILILYMVSPFFAAVMPLDDGEKMKSWQDMFVGKIFTGFGTVLAMQMYLMICPMVMTGDISFGEGSKEADYLIRFIFLMGGAWTVINAGPTITQIFSYQAGMAEKESQGIGMGIAMAAGRQAYGATRQGIHRMRHGKEEGQGGAQGGGQGGGQGGMKAVKASNLKGMSGRRVGLYQNSAGKSRMGVNIKGMRVGENRKGEKSAKILGMGATWKKGADGKRKLTGLSLGKSKFKPGADGKMKLSSSKVAGMKFKKLTGPDGKSSMKMTAFKPLGIKREMNAQGKMQHTGKLKLPLVKCKADENGKFHVSRLNLGVATWKGTTSTSVNEAGEKVTSRSLKFESCAPLGLSRSADENGKMHTQSFMGMSMGLEQGDRGYDKAAAAMGIDTGGGSSGGGGSFGGASISDAPSLRTTSRRASSASSVSGGYTASGAKSAPSVAPPPKVRASASAPRAASNKSTMPPTVKSAPAPKVTTTATTPRQTVAPKATHTSAAKATIPTPAQAPTLQTKRTVASPTVSHAKSTMPPAAKASTVHTPKVSTPKTPAQTTNRPKGTRGDGKS